MRIDCLTRAFPFLRHVITVAAMLIGMVAAFVSVPASAGPPVGITSTTRVIGPRPAVRGRVQAIAKLDHRFGGGCPIDSNGWPTQDANIYVWAGQALNMSGTYALSFSGQATVSGSGGAFSNQAYDPSANLITATVTMTNADLNLTFTNTRRTSSSATNTGITNARLMRPTSYGAGTSYPTSPTLRPRSRT